MEIINPFPKLLFQRQSREIYEQRPKSFSWLVSLSFDCSVSFSWLCWLLPSTCFSLTNFSILSVMFLNNTTSFYTFFHDSLAGCGVKWFWPTITNLCPNKIIQCGQVLYIIQTSISQEFSNQDFLQLNLANLTGKIQMS